MVRVPTSRAVRWALRVGLAFVCFAAPLAVAEVAARLLLPGWTPTIGERALFWDHHPVLGWAHRPGATGRFTGPSWDAEVIINAKGLRDVDREYGGSERRRVLVLGDSFAWGYGVDQDRMVTAELERICPSWEFVNAGVSGYGTDQQYLYYREEGYKYGAAEVLLMVFGNDMFESSCAFQYGHGKPQFVSAGGKLELTNVPVPKPTLRQDIYNGLVGRSFLAAKFVYLTGLDERMDAACGGRLDLELNEQLLALFDEEVDRRNARLKWVLIPARPGRPDQVQRFYPRIARRLGVPYLDLSPALAEAAARGESLTLEGDIHWNDAGHAIAAAAIAESLDCIE